MFLKASNKSDLIQMDFYLEMLNEQYPTTEYTIYHRDIKVAGADMRYFAMSKFSRSLVYKESFTLIWQVVFELGYIFCQER